ncbi:MAG TPA: class E sortase [Solirubrobacteraceae bacterium]|nr:class E sortase [Solirubrobacteraceae bacterium]
MGAIGLEASGFKPRPRRRLIRGLALLLIVSGVLLLVDVAVTLVWQEPVTAGLGLIERTQINRHWLSYRSAPLSAVESRIVAAIVNQRQELAFLARREQRGLRTGEAVGRLSIPSIGVSFLVVQGTDSTSLEKGPGHYPSTALPGLDRTVAIAGHRTTFLAPFRHLDALRAGEKIVLGMPYGRFVYTVQYHRVVSPTAWWITRNAGYDRLVLSACDPLFSASHRLVVFARLTRLPVPVS